MKYRLFESIVLERELPEHRLHRGDTGAIVELYEPDGVEVEFMDAAGRTLAVVTLNVDDIRPVDDDDLAKRAKARTDRRAGPNPAGAPRG